MSAKRGAKQGAKQVAEQGFGLTRAVALVVAILGIGLLNAVTSICAGASGWLLAPACIGLALGGIRSTRQWVAAVLSGASALIGPVITMVAVTNAHMTSRATPMPSVISGDVSNLLAKNYLFPLIQTSIISPGREPVGLIFAPVVAVACTMGVRFLLERYQLPRWSGSALALAGLAVVFVVGAAQPGAIGWFEHPIGKYGFDAAIYRMTFENMKAGQSYYPALVAAAAGDQRIKDVNGVHDGRFYSGWTTSPAQIRPPYLFEFWALLAPNPLGVFILGSCLALLGMLSVYLGLRLYIGEAAALAAFALLPLLQMAVAWSALFQPDAWAGMFTLLAVGLWLSRRFSAAMVVALIAGICRDLALLALVVFAAYAVYRAVRGDREWLRRAIVGGALLAAFVALYVVHLAQAAPYYATAQGPVGIIASTLKSTAAGNFASKFLTPVSYEGIMWWILFIQPVFFLPVAAIGWVWALRRNLTALVPIGAIFALWVLFLAVVGAHASYWGLMFTPLMYAGAGAFVACAAVTACGRNPWANAGSRGSA